MELLLEKIIRFGARYQENLKSAQTSLFGESSDEVYQELVLPLTTEWQNLEQLKKMLVLLSEERKVVLSHHKTFEHVEKMRAIVNESIEMANK